MREIKTLILRLLVDADEPQTLRGLLSAVANGEENSFTDEQSLLALLHRIGHTTGESIKASDGREESPKGSR